MPRPRTLFLLLFALTGGCTCGGDRDPDPAPGPDTRAWAREAIRASHVDWDDGERQVAIDAGVEALVRHECNRCHTIDDVEPAARPLHCTSCHQWLEGLTPDHRNYALLSSRYGEAVVQRYQRNIVHYVEVPDLTRIGARLRPSWMGEFIAQPYDVRPSLDETMVRTNVPEADLRAIVRYFAAVAEVADPYAADRPTPSQLARPSAARLAEGRALFVPRCGICHTFGNVDTGRTAEDLIGVGWPAKMAPNLRFTRDRMSAEITVAWILDPSAFSEPTLMPASGLSLEQAETVRDFLFFGDPELRPAPAAPSLEPPPPATRAVTWAEVKERVLGDVCVHCHMNDYERDDGPGNQGGFGWPGSRLQMRTYETLVFGAVYQGERRGVLEPTEGTTVSPLVAALMRRRVEEQRDHVPAFLDYERPAYPDAPPGMPMGLPSIDDEGVALIRAWIAEGCPGPTEITGMPGIDDGYLVPDGPIADNEGCGMRAPAEDRPAWSTQPPPSWHHREDRPASPP